MKLIIKYYLPSDEGGGDPKEGAPVAPKGFTPLTIAQRTQWNGFLDYLDKMGVAGSPVLDKRDQSAGIGFMNKYKKMNPDFSLTPDDISRVQYDQYLLRKGTSYPTMSNEELQYVRNGLSPAYMARQVSPIDNWLGSITSKLYYPQAKRLLPNGNIDFGTDVENYAKSLKNPDLQKGFPIVAK